MKEKGKGKLMPFLLTLILLLSMITFMPTGTLAQEVKWYNEYDAEKTVFTDMTPGDIITVKGSDLTQDERYFVYFENESGGAELLDDQRADEDGNIEIEVYVPYRNILQDYDLYLLNETDVLIGSIMIVSITNSYQVKYQYGGNYIDNVLQNKPYVNLMVSVWNWTGSKYEILDETINVDLLNPESTSEISHTISTGYWDLDWTFDYDVDNQYENNYWIEVTDVSGHYAKQPLPVKLNMTATLPSNPKWGDTITVQGYVYNGTHAIGDYTVLLLAPSGNTYIPFEATTYGTGRYSLSVYSDEDGRSAGTWYVGTWNDGAYRINETDIVNWPGFIKYYSFEVATLDTAVVKLEDPDKVITGFDQDLNISVYNSWDDDYYEDMWIHITGVETEYNGQTYDADEIIVLGNNWIGTSSTGKYAYYEFYDIQFNESGQVTIIATWDNNNDYYEDIDGLKANISGSTTFSVSSAASMNIYVENMVDAVTIDDSDSCCWVNSSVPITIEIYGDSVDKPMNATIYITGCGLDIEIPEEDAIEDGYWQYDGGYLVDVSPKTAGTITIRCVNDTENISSSREFSISGLTGSLTTSVGNNKEISVDSTEKITFTVNFGQFAEVTACYYDINWDVLTRICINNTVGDNTAGNGLNGIFEFTPDVDDLDHVGYIVIVAVAGGNYIYDIIEVAPMHDLVIELTNPSNASLQTLTCGLGHDWQFKIKDKAGVIVDDIDYVTAEVLDEDEDTVQIYNLKEKTGNIWYMDDFIPHFTGDLLITAWNNSEENEHDGNMTLLIDCATIEYTPGGTIAGIGLEDITVNVTGKDANGNALPEGTKLYINVENSSVIDIDTDLILDKYGKGEFNIADVGDLQQDVNVTLQGWWDCDYNGNLTCGTFYVMWPNFDLNPDTIYIGQSNTITVTATDYTNEPIEGINLTFYGSESQVLAGVVPDPVMTDADGVSTFSISPTSSGKLNLTIVKEIVWNQGVIDWSGSDVLVTDQFLTITSLKQLIITVSKSPIYEAETLTIKILSGTSPVSDVAVTIGEQTAKTDANGEVTFIMPNPGVDSAIYSITAQKSGYITAEKSITIIKKWEITIVGPITVGTGTSFTITTIAKGQPLAGATVTYNGNTVTTDGEGKAKITAPSTAGDIIITATFGDYKPGTLTVTSKAEESPGFELITLIIAIGVALILIKRRRN